MVRFWLFYHYFYACRTRTYPLCPLGVAEGEGINKGVKGKAFSDALIFFIKIPFTHHLILYPYIFFATLFASSLPLLYPSPFLPPLGVIAEGEGYVLLRKAKLRSPLWGIEVRTFFVYPFACRASKMQTKGKETEGKMPYHL